MLTLEYDENTIRMNGFSYARYFTAKTFITKTLGSKFICNEKQEVLTWRNKLLRQAY